MPMRKIEALVGNETKLLIFTHYHIKKQYFSVKSYKVNSLFNTIKTYSKNLFTTIIKYILIINIKEEV
jgi:hypothetical protein